MTAIDTTGLTKRYGEALAVDGLDLSIPDGTVYGFLGPNGAGKTTTMRMLTGLTSPTSGTGSVAGAAITDRDELRSHIGYLPEDPPLYEQATCYEQLDYVAGLHGLPSDAIQDRIDELLDEFDLAEDAGTRIAEYSKGMRQKVAYIQTVLHDPDVVLLDEPTSGLDPRAARTIREMITDLAESGTTVFLSTHILPVVEQVADTVGILYDGDLVAEDAPDTLTQRVETGQKQTLEEVFLELTGTDPAMDGGDTNG